MDAEKIAKVRILAEALPTVQWITQETGERQPYLLKRLVDAERRRLERAKTQRADWNRL